MGRSDQTHVSQRESITKQTQGTRATLRNVCGQGLGGPANLLARLFIFLLKPRSYKEFRSVSKPKSSSVKAASSPELASFCCLDTEGSQCFLHLVITTQLRDWGQGSPLASPPPPPPPPNSLVSVKAPTETACPLRCYHLFSEC